MPFMLLLPLGNISHPGSQSKFPGRGDIFTFGSSTILGPVSGILGDPGISSSAGVLLGTAIGP